MPNGKSEAWYVLDAAPGAKVAVGLKAPLHQDQLRQAINDGSIANLVDWQPVKAGDIIAVPAGTIHAIGAGVVIAEIQQRSDATFRLFDHGRARALHIDDALAVAVRTLPDVQPESKRLTAERTLLANEAHFIMELIVLASGSKWCLDAARETWLVVLDGIVDAGSYDLVRGDAIFARDERVDLSVGRSGLKCLVAYTGVGGPLPLLLQRIAQQGTRDAALPGNNPGAYLQIGSHS
ncbi:MAG: class I mannose-6-phosphate isomerase [Hyphomicrobiaceae bacterium]